MNKKSMTPIMATLLLVVFALIIGTATMNWGKEYVEKINNMESNNPINDPDFGICLGGNINLDTQLKILQSKHICGMISEDEYYREEKKIAIS